MERRVRCESCGESIVMAAGVDHWRRQGVFFESSAGQSLTVLFFHS